MDGDFSLQANRILDSAQGLIATGGYRGFSYADISAEVGLSKASIHHHFPRKSDLVRVLLRRYRAQASSSLAGVTRTIGNPLSRLQAYAGWWAECIGDGSMPICLCAMLGADTAALPKDVALEVRHHLADVTRWIESALEAGHAGGFLHLRGSPAVEADAFLATVHGAMLSARACDRPEIFEEVMGVAMERLAAPA